VVIGTSSGGIDALRTQAATLPADFAPPICVVIHVAPHSPGIIHEIHGRAGNLPAFKATDGMPLTRGF
jgi:two-component system chemotaxis response regulator CheB